MKNIDIIKAAQHVKDDLVSEAIDFAPVQRRSFKIGYIAAACAAIALVAVPVIVRQYGSLAPDDTELPSLSSVDSGSTAAYGEPIFSEYYDIPVRRTFYNYSAEEYTDWSKLTSKGKVYLSDSLTECMARRHDEGDEFAIRVIECSGASNEEIYKWLYENCISGDKDKFLADNSTPIYLPEKLIREKSAWCASPKLAIAFTLAPGEYRRDIVDEDLLKTDTFGKFYAEIQLDYDYEKAAAELDPPRAVDFSGQEIENLLVSEAVENYIKKFAEDHGVDTRLLYAGKVDSYWGTLSGEFDTETLGKMLGDKRVVSIIKSNGGGYTFEQRRGGWLKTVMVTRNQMKAIPSGSTYAEIIKKLGETASYGDSNRQYMTESGELILLNFENENDVCTLSGVELYDSAVPLRYAGTLPSTVSEDMTYGVIVSDRWFIWVDSNGYMHSGHPIISDNCQIVHEDGSKASAKELFQSGKRMFIGTGEELYNSVDFPATKIVILDDPINSNADPDPSTESGEVSLSDKTISESDIEAVIKNYNDNGKSVLDPSVTGAEVYDTKIIDLDFDGKGELLVLVGQANYKALEVWEKSGGEMKLANSFGAGKVNFIDNISLKKAEIDREKVYLFSFAYDEGNSMKAEEVLSAIRQTADGYEVEYLLSRGTISWTDISGSVTKVFYRKGWSKYDIGWKDYGDITKEEYDALYGQYTGLSDFKSPDYPIGFGYVTKNS